jgi:DNA-binding response OmpR family regulator
VAERTQSILIVEDDLDVAEMLTAYFNVQGYDVAAVNWGEDALRAARASRPDLVILDIRLPDIDGFEVAQRLRSNRRTEDIPIIFLTEKRNRPDRLQGLQVGADDYITKPFDIQELRLRVRNALRRSSQGSLTNPVTGLAEGALVDERLDECLKTVEWGILGVTLENLDAFREAYGFVASDDVVRAVSLMIHNAVRDIGSPGDFVGHLHHGELLIVGQPDNLPALAERIRSRLEQSLDYFYPLKDRSPADQPERRLAVSITLLLASQGPFSDLAHLKAALAQRRT